MLPHGVDLKDQEVTGRVVRVSSALLLRKPKGVTLWCGALLRGTTTNPLRRDGGPTTT
jgi:hypothetical protein